MLKALFTISWPLPLAAAADSCPYLLHPPCFPIPSLCCIAIYPDGHVIQGTEALKALFTTVGLGWAVYISDLPIITYLVDALYHVS